MWDVETGTLSAKIGARSSVRTANFSYSGNQTAYSTDKAMGHNCELFIVDTRTFNSSVSEADPILRLPMNVSKITSLLWSLDEVIITGHENGEISLWDLRVSFFYQIYIINKFFKINIFLDGQGG